MASTDEKVGRQASSSWGAPRQKWAKRAGAKAIRKLAKQCGRLYFLPFIKKGKNDTDKG